MKSAKTHYTLSTIRDYIHQLELLMRVLWLSQTTHLQTTFDFSLIAKIAWPSHVIYLIEKLFVLKILQISLKSDYNKKLFNLLLCK